MNAITKSLLLGLTLTFAVGCASPTDDDADRSVDPLETSGTTVSPRGDSFEKSAPDVIEGDTRIERCAPSISPDPWKRDRGPFVPSQPSQKLDKDAVFGCK